MSLRISASWLLSRREARNLFNRTSVRVKMTL